MDPSELLPIVAATLVALLSIAAFFRVRRIDSRLLRLSLAGCTGVLTLLALLVAGASIFFYVNYTKHPGPLGSPDHQRVAITTYTVNNGTGRDEVEVAIRHVWSPYAHRVFTGQTHYQPGSTTQDPKVRWIDNMHLEIAFHTYVSDGMTARAPRELATGCASFAGRIEITCIENRVHAVR